MKIINCIYSKNKLDFKKYLKSTKFDDVISFYDIIAKIIKNDNIKSVKPSDIVINSYIRKKIIKTISDEKNEIILYALKNLDLETIKEIKSLIKENYKGRKKIKFNLIVIKYKNNLPDNKLFLKEFDNISFIDNL